MDIIEKLEKYLHDVFGGSPKIDGVSLSSLPLFLQAFDCLFIQFDEYSAIAAIVREDVHSADEYKVLSRKLGRELDGEVIFVFAELTNAKRNQLIREKVPFMVPGAQFYFPPFLQLKEAVQKYGGRKTVLTPSAQMTVIWQLLIGNLDGCSGDELAQRMGFSKVTAMSVFSQLEGADLIASNNQWPRRMRFQHRGKELWDKALQGLTSPVKRIRYNAMPGFDHWIQAGESALARYTMLAPGKLPVYAIEEKELKRRGLNVLVDAHYNPVSDQYEARSVLQVWKYKPDFCQEGRVDRLSLYLSMRGERDPRIQGELESLLEGVEWK